jgi:hypothetical protein
MSVQMRRQSVRDDTREILRHWQEAVPHDRLAHLVRDATPSTTAAILSRPTEHFAIE